MGDGNVEEIVIPIPKSTGVDTKANIEVGEHRANYKYRRFRVTTIPSDRHEGEHAFLVRRANLDRIWGFRVYLNSDGDLGIFVECNATAAVQQAEQRHYARKSSDPFGQSGLSHYWLPLLVSRWGIFNPGQTKFRYSSLALPAASPTRC